MPEPILLRDEQGREVVKFTTPCGVTAWVATCIPDEALRGFARSLKRKLRAGEQRRAKEALARSGRARRPRRADSSKS